MRKVYVLEGIESDGSLGNLGTSPFDVSGVNGGEPWVFINVELSKMVLDGRSDISLVSFDSKVSWTSYLFPEKYEQHHVSRTCVCTFERGATMFS